MITDAVPAPTLCVSIVVFRSDLLRLAATLESLQSALQLAMAAGDLAAATVVIHDNGSPAEYSLRLKRLYRVYQRRFADGCALELSLSAVNEGFGSGHNRVLNGRCDDCLLILNPDIELDANALCEGLRTLRQRPGVVGLGPRCTGGEGQWESLCKRYPTVLDLLLRGFGRPWLQRRFRGRLARYEYRDLDGEPAVVTLVSGACMLLRREVFVRVGGFDERFFMYFEDFDLSLRAAAHGELLYQPAMQVVHHGGYAARKGWRHIRWFLLSARRFFATHGWRWA